MPTIHTLGSIKIDVYSRDHLPPHFHVIYAEREALIIIRTLGIYAGSLPPAQLKTVLNWAKDPIIMKMLLDNFNRLNPNLRQ